MNKIIIPTGYMGSGSSAITDLIAEFKGYSADRGSFEYIFLHCPNGVFDLEDKLLTGNNAIRSDEAIHSFEAAMKELYESRYWWPGNYKENLSPAFMELTEEYIDSITEFTSDSYWYMQQKLDEGKLRKALIQGAVSKVTGGKVKFKRPLMYEPMKLCLMSPEEFYDKSRQYIRKLMTELGIEQKNLILDQLLLPFNLWRMENYFDDNAECFVIERDPRDVFYMNKYIWSAKNDAVAYPLDAEMFCKYYKKMRNTEKPADSSHIHRIKFEDLIYRYDETVKNVLDSLGLSPEDHIYRREKFNPDISINNTQLYLKMEPAEREIIERELASYLYDFPYERNADETKSF